MPWLMGTGGMSAPKRWAQGWYLVSWMTPARGPPPSVCPSGAGAVLQAAVGEAGRVRGASHLGEEGFAGSTLLSSVFSCSGQHRTLFCCCLQSPKCFPVSPYLLRLRTSAGLGGVDSSEEHFPQGQGVIPWLETQLLV